MRPKIIAEIGWNHMGDLNLAKEMIFAAHENGADYAKFQTWSVKNLKPVQGNLNICEYEWAIASFDFFDAA